MTFQLDSSNVKNPLMDAKRGAPEGGRLDVLVPLVEAWGGQALLSRLRRKSTLTPLFADCGVIPSRE